MNGNALHVVQRLDAHANLWNAHSTTTLELMLDVT